MGSLHAPGASKKRPWKSCAPGTVQSCLSSGGPLGGVLVALVVLALAQAEHRELVRIPAGDDVEPEAPARDVVGGRAHLRHEQRVHERCVHGREDLDAVGHGEQRRPTT